MSLDRRLHACRDDLADERLRGLVAAARFAVGRPARVVAGRAAVRAAPDAQAEILTFYHYGESVLVFEEAAGVIWCQSLFDGYVGYVDAEHLAPDTGAATHFVVTSGSYAYAAPDLQSAPVDFLPRHSAVVVAAAGLLTRGTEYAWLDTGSCLPLACLSRDPPRSPDLAAAAALYLGCPYLWAGRSFLGLDCSGLVQSAFRDIGVTVPRDTDLQRDAIGAAMPFAGEADLCRGDLLFLPGHVLIYEGDGTVIHADGASMMVRREQLAQLIRRRGLDLTDFVVRRV
jgi:cell wall-associated NlpC family hydrolase